jgi:hypothetical protein
MWQKMSRLQAELLTKELIKLSSRILCS